MCCAGKYASNQFPIAEKSAPAQEGALYYYPHDSHPGQFIARGEWWRLERERKRLSSMGYDYTKFKKRYT